MSKTCKNGGVEAIKKIITTDNSKKNTNTTKPLTNQEVQGIKDWMSQYKH